MAYFPMFVDLRNQLCVVIGGGMVACRKVTALLEFEADIMVIAPDICKNIGELKEKITIQHKNYESSDIEKAYLVIAATNDMELNQRISGDCRVKKIPVNVVDVQEECDFIFPAYIKKGPITIGVTSSGKSPVLSQLIKKRVMEAVPDYMEELANNLGDARDEIKHAFAQEENRKKVFKTLVESGIKNEGKLTRKDIEDAIEKEKHRH